LQGAALRLERLLKHGLEAATNFALMCDLCFAVVPRIVADDLKLDKKMAAGGPDIQIA
jgi:hypothetical protein